MSTRYSGGFLRTTFMTRHASSARRAGRTATVWIAAVASLTTPAVGQELLDEPPTNSGPVSVSAPVSPAISDRDISRYSKRLALDDAKLVLKSLYLDYLDAYREIEITEIRALNEASLAVTESGPGFINTVFAEGYRDLMQQRQGVLDRLARLDDQLLDYLSAILPNEAQPEVGRIRLERRRVRANLDVAMLPAANVDLSRVVREVDLRPESRAAIDAVLIDYEVAVTPAMERRFAGRVALSVSDNLTLARAFEDDSGQLYTPQTADETSRVQAILEERHATFRKQFGRNRLVRDLNAQYLNRIEACLDEAEQRWVHDAFVARAYSGLYPDPCSVHAILDEALGLAGLRPEQHEALIALRPDVAPAYREACATLEERFVEWREFLANNMAYTPEAFQVQQEAMSGAKRLRLEASAVCAARVRAVLRGDQARVLSSLQQLDHEMTLSSGSTSASRSPGSR